MCSVQLKATDSDIIQIDYKDESTIKSAAADLLAKNVCLDVLVNVGGEYSQDTGRRLLLKTFRRARSPA
jgi:short-subunit dehydrogenase